jgi:hypothetical protein
MMKIIFITNKIRIFLSMMMKILNKYNKDLLTKKMKEIIKVNILMEKNDLLYHYSQTIIFYSELFA